MKRTDALAKLVVLPALTIALTTGTFAVARADSRTQLKYQTQPKGKQKCLGCALFTVGTPVTANGTCSVIKGAISPNGWCTAYIPKSS
jgi:hypothetical protein